MESTTISTRTLEIEGMSGDACVQKVTNALKHVHGVSMQSVNVGTATIGADAAGFKSACSAVAGAGYKVRDGQRNGENKSENTAGAKSSTEGKPDDQTRTGTQNQPGNVTGASRTGEPSGTNGAPKPAAAKV